MKKFINGLVKIMYFEKSVFITLFFQFTCLMIFLELNNAIESLPYGEVITKLFLMFYTMSVCIGNFRIGRICANENRTIGYSLKRGLLAFIRPSNYLVALLIFYAFVDLLVIRGIVNENLFVQGFTYIEILLYSVGVYLLFCLIQFKFRKQPIDVARNLGEKI